MKIDPAAAISLQGIIEQDLTAIDDLNSRLDQIFAGTPGESDTIAGAYHLHNVYSALENSFEQISRTFENHIVEPARWHRELLSKMFLDLSPIRPAVLPENVRHLLHEMLRFRHLFRHSYDFKLDAAKLDTLHQEWKRGRGWVNEALRTFANRLGECARASS